VLYEVGPAAAVATLNRQGAREARGVATVGNAAPAFLFRSCTVCGMELSGAACGRPKALNALNFTMSETLHKLYKASAPPTGSA